MVFEDGLEWGEDGRAEHHRFPGQVLSELPGDMHPEWLPEDSWVCWVLFLGYRGARDGIVSITESMKSVCFDLYPGLQ